MHLCNMKLMSCQLGIACVKCQIATATVATAISAPATRTVASTVWHLADPAVAAVTTSCTYTHTHKGASRRTASCCKIIKYIYWKYVFEIYIYISYVHTVKRALGHHKYSLHSNARKAHTHIHTDTNITVYTYLFICMYACICYIACNQAMPIVCVKYWFNADRLASQHHTYVHTYTWSAVQPNARKVIEELVVVLITHIAGEYPCICFLVAVDMVHISTFTWITVYSCGSLVNWPRTNWCELIVGNPITSRQEML